MSQLYRIVLAPLVLAPITALAQPFPPSQIRVVVPFPPAGPTDVIARHVGQALAEQLKTAVVVDNRPGASAMIGSEHVARSAPSGSVLLFNATHQVTNSVFFKKLPYDPVKDFAGVALVASIPSVLVLHPSVPARSVKELIARAKQEPGKLSMATFGGANQLSSELFKSMAGVEILNIEYKGAAPSLTDVVGGHVPMMFNTLGTVLPYVTSNKLLALGVTGLERSKLLPSVPTIAEAGPLPGYEAVAWFGLFMPVGNAEVQAKLAETMTAALSTKDMRDKLAKQGADPGALTGPAFQKFVESELVKWSGVGVRANIQKQ
ncbi:MAG: tripartite tricarboxylate transporter substrate binding protein [Burkholderiales bacterium]|nr:tripartite tricarboxylate transporter substrate binding protein [Burkholderiales bacterium]